MSGPPLESAPPGLTTVVVAGTDQIMDEHTQRRLANNESRFRAANERLEAAAIRLDGRDHHYPFVCECDRLECCQTLRLTVPEYEHGRSDPLWFIHAPGHGITIWGFAAIVEQYPGYEIVEKQGLAGEAAKETDLRSQVPEAPRPILQRTEPRIVPSRSRG